MISERSSRHEPTGFIDDPAMYLSQPYPSLQGSLPNTDPAQLNYDGPWLTTAKTPIACYVQNYSLTVQYLLPQQTVLEVAFVGNKGTRLWGGTAFLANTTACRRSSSPWAAF